MSGRGALTRDGVTTIAVVFLTLAVTLVAHGLLTFATLELSASRAGRELVQARLGAEAAVWRSLNDTSARGGARAALWSVTDSIRGVLTPGDRHDPAFSDSLTVAVPFTADRMRLSREVWLARGRSSVGRVRHATMRPFWLLDPAARVAAAEAALVIGDTLPPRLDGSVGVDSFYVRSGPLDCPTLSAAVDSIRAGAALPAWSRVPGDGSVALGRLTLDSLVLRMPLRVDGSGTPGPAERGGRCLTDDAWNWGDPARRGRSCSLHSAAVVGAPGLRVVSGVGQGILVLEGDGTLLDVDFRGVVVAGGRLVLGGRTSLLGLVRARGGVHVGAESRMEASACWAAAALAHPALGVGVPIPESGWVGPG